MNPFAELALVLALFAALVAVSYAMRWLHDRPVAAEAVPAEPEPFLSEVMLTPAFYDPEDDEEE